MDSINSLELTTTKRQYQQQNQQKTTNSFNLLSIDLLERRVSEGDQSDSDEVCNHEVNQSRINSNHDEVGVEHGEVDNEGVDRVENEDENDQDELQVSRQAREQKAPIAKTRINLEESNSFDGSNHDDNDEDDDDYDEGEDDDDDKDNEYLSNQQGVDTATKAVAITATSVPKRITVETSRSSSHLQLQQNQQNAHHYQRQHQQQQHQQHQQQQQHHHHHHHHQPPQHKNKPLNNNGTKEFDEVKQVELFGIGIVALIINGKERLCLAQISNTLLKEFSYNEIHNRRVALGITCIQCTPIQLEMLRRAGAMPSSSRRCGMITMREAERLCRSFLVEEQPPELPENFYFTVAHRVNYGCKGRFVPARYISSRAKCIECFYCGEYYSPNKFIFHSHRQPHVTDCNPPDSPNINSWRKHIDLDWTQEHGQDIKYAWEDVKSLFNGGTRRRAPNQSTQLSSTNGGSANGGANISIAGSSCGPLLNNSNNNNNNHNSQSSRNQKQHIDDEQVIVDVECDDSTNKNVALNELNEFKLESNINNSGNSKRSTTHSNKIWPLNNARFSSNQGNRSFQNNSLINSKHQTMSNNQITKANPANPANGSTILSTKRFSSSNSQNHQFNKRFATNNNLTQQPVQINQDNQTDLTLNKPDIRFQTQNSIRQSQLINPPHSLPSHHHSPSIHDQHQHQHQQQQPLSQPIIRSLPFSSSDFLNQSDLQTNTTANQTAGVIKNQSQTIIPPTRHHQQQTNPPFNDTQSNAARNKAALDLVYPMSNNTSNFIYSQLYSQLIQPQQQAQPQLQHQVTNQQHSASLDAQTLALRHHIWSSLLANLQCNASGQTYSLQQNNNNHCNNVQTLISPETADSIPSPANLSHLFSIQSYPQQQQQQQQQHSNHVSSKIQAEPNSNTHLTDSPYKSNSNVPFSPHKSFQTGEANDM